MDSKFLANPRWFMSCATCIGCWRYKGTSQRSAILEDKMGFTRQSWRATEEPMGESMSYSVHWPLPHLTPVTEVPLSRNHGDRREEHLPPTSGRQHSLAEVCNPPTIYWQNYSPQLTQGTLWGMWHWSARPLTLSLIHLVPSHPWPPHVTCSHWLWNLPSTWVQGGK